ncbi:GNAT family N-acetyltransferase [Uliginosibacterium sp. sgz301328]|uniref:GNAT family N-acetyltransferase n=1 Tax=Uliginosibacterium sp. sgz301328 TaxID=3243764 RepID=UPI00359DE9D1
MAKTNSLPPHPSSQDDVRKPKPHQKRAFLRRSPADRLPITMEYTLQSGFDRMDFPRVTAMLATAFWSPGIGIDEVIAGSKHSALLVGAFDPQGDQIGFARVISDQTRFAYILDVIVDEPHRRQGIGQAMVQHILGHSDLASVYQWLLITRDSHGVYEKLGFRRTERGPDWMEIRSKRPAR